MPTADGQAPPEVQRNRWYRVSPGEPMLSPFIGWIDDEVAPEIGGRLKQKFTKYAVYLYVGTEEEEGRSRKE